MLWLMPLLLAATPAPDWPSTLRADARAIHDDILANHPGPVNGADPAFRAREAAAYALVLRRAAAVHDIAGYRFALKGYIASFDDGHVAFGIKDESLLPTPRWPGFLTGVAADGRQRVLARTEAAPVPLGAELVECDGVAAATLVARNVGAFEGRWSLRSTRATRSGWLLVDRRNPFVRRPQRCDFRIEGRARRVTLAWTPIDPIALGRHLGPVNSFARPAIAMRTLSDGTRWFTISSFAGDPAGESAKALTAMIAGMARDRVALGEAPAIVLDLRGNGGGSSAWSVQIAKLLWGERRMATQAASDGSYVEWRASPATLAALAAYEQQFASAQNVDPKLLAYFPAITDGLRRAVAAGRPLWREPDAIAKAYQQPDTRTFAAEPVPLAGPVFVLTDPACASACLDAVDLWRALGAVQVGRETSADTLYMDVRDRDLPSGLATLAVPMKVYRGRARGSNVPWRPAHRFDGDMADVPALEHWVASLPERRR